MRIASVMSMVMVVAVVAVGVAQAEVIANYDFNDNTASSDTNGYTTASNFVVEIGAWVNANDMLRAYFGDAYTTEPPIIAPDLATSISSNYYQGFTVSIANGTTLELDTLEYTFGASYTYYSWNVEIYLLVDADGDGWDTGDMIDSYNLKDYIPSGTAATNNMMIDLTSDISSLADGAGGSDIEFRLYFSDSFTGSTAYSLRLDDVVLSGTAISTRTNIIAKYDFNDNTASSDTEENTTASNFVVEIGEWIDANNMIRAFYGDDVTVEPPIIAIDLATSISSNYYEGFTVDVDPGATLELGLLRYAFGVSYRWAGHDVEIYLLVDADGNGWDTGDMIDSYNLMDYGVTSGMLNLTSDISSLADVAGGSDIEFRFYFSDNYTGATTHSLRLDDVELNGTVIPPPKGTLIIIK